MPEQSNLKALYLVIALPSCITDYVQFQLLSPKNYLVDFVNSDTLKLCGPIIYEDSANSLVNQNGTIFISPSTPLSPSSNLMFHLTTFAPSAYTAPTT